VNGSCSTNLRSGGAFTRSNYCDGGWPGALGSVSTRRNTIVPAAAGGGGDGGDSSSTGPSAAA
jgi:hypothetical protein